MPISFLPGAGGGAGGGEVTLAPGSEVEVVEDNPIVRSSLTAADPVEIIDVLDAKELYIQAWNTHATLDGIFTVFGSMDSTNGTNGYWQDAEVIPLWRGGDSSQSWWTVEHETNASNPTGPLVADVSAFRFLRIQVPADNGVDLTAQVIELAYRASRTPGSHTRLMSLDPYTTIYEITNPVAVKSGVSTLRNPTITINPTPALESTNDYTAWSVQDLASVLLSMSGTFVMETVFEGCADDGGTTWFPIEAVRTSSGHSEGSTGYLSGPPGYSWTISTVGLSYVRVRANFHTSGAQSWTMRAVNLGTAPPRSGPSGSVTLLPVDGDAVISGVTQSVEYDVSETPFVRAHCSGTFSATDTFEGSMDGFTWTPVEGRRSTGNVSESSTGALAAIPGYSWEFNLLGYTRFRIRNTAYTSGSQTWTARGVNAAIPGPSPVPTHAVSGTVAATNSVLVSTAAGLGKAEDAAHASGDVGVPAWLVRAPATPASPTSAAGDYSYSMGDAEGKTIISGAPADPSLTFDSNIALTTTSDVALRAAQAAGIRTYATDFVFENTGAAAARVLVRDGTTTRLTVTLAAGQTLHIQPRTPLRGTAATALNAQLGAAGTVTVTTYGYSAV